MLYSIFLKCFLLLCLCFTHTYLYAERKGRFNLWYVYNGLYILSDKWRISAGGHYRTFNTNITDIRLYLLRSSLEYRFKDIPLILGSGYMFLDIYSWNNHNTKKSSFLENRLYQYAILEQSIGKANIEHRFRIEERWQQGRDKIRHRYRYRFLVEIPLNSRSNIIPKTWTLTLFNELRLTNIGAPFESNRLYTGISYRLLKSLGLGMAWIMQTSTVRSEHHISFIVSHLIRRK